VAPGENWGVRYEPRAEREEWNVTKCSSEDTAKLDMAWFDEFAHTKPAVHGRFADKVARMKAAYPSASQSRRRDIRTVLARIREALEGAPLG